MTKYIEKSYGLFFTIKFKQLATFWAKKVESGLESNAFTVTDSFPFKILTGRSFKMTCEFSDGMSLILLPTKGISQFSSLFIEFCCGAVRTVFTLFA